MTDGFGPSLREWRSRRRMSQLDLGLTADVSARHISFLESGRSQPSRVMVMRLCDALDLPHKARNPMLAAAGFAPAYAARDLDEADLAPIRSAVDWMLTRHAPFPAFAIDRHWRLIELNMPASRLFSVAGIGKSDSLITELAGNEVLRQAIVNLPEVIAHSLARLRTENAHYGDDDVLDGEIRKLAASANGADMQNPAIMPAFIPATYRLGDMELSFVTTIAQFGTIEDIAIAELKIELMFPADETTRQAMIAMAVED